MDLPALFREYARLEKRRLADGLSVEQLQRWQQLKRSLATRFKPGLDPGTADKQASLRVPSRLQVEFESMGELRASWMTNMSRGGIFVATDRPLPLGTPFALRIEIGETGEALALSGVVASVNTGPDLMSEEEGMGIRFHQLSEAQQRQVDDLYQRLMEAAVERVARR